MAETSQGRLAYAAESTYGTNPATGAKFARITSESLAETPSYVVSEEINGSRNPRDQIRTAVGAGGGVDFEFSINNFDDLVLVGGLMASLPAAPSLITGNIAAVAATQKLTSSGTPSLAGISKGQWFRTSGFSNAANNGIFRAAANSISTEVQAITGSGIVDEASAARNVQPSQLIRPGSTLKSWTLERQWTDDTIFQIFLGMVVESLSLSMAVEQKITGSLNFVGKSAAAAATSSGIGTVSAAGTESIAAAVDAFRGFREGTLASDSAYKLTEINLSFNNATRIKRAISDLTPFGVGLGIIEIEAAVKLFLANKNLIDKFKDNTVTPLSWRIEGPASSDPDYVITMPEARITALTNPLSGNSQDGFIDATFMAETDSDGVAFQVDKIAAIP